MQSAKEQQKIRLEEIEIEVVQRKKQIDIEEKEIIRTDKELIATVRRPAEAEAYRMQQIAEGDKCVYIVPSCVFIRPGLHVAAEGAWLGSQQGLQIDLAWLVKGCIVSQINRRLLRSH